MHFGSVTETVSFANVTYQFISGSVTEKLMQSKAIQLIRSLNPEAIVLHGFHASFSAYRFVVAMKDFRIYIQHHGEKVFSFPKSLVQKRLDRYVAGYFFTSKELGEAWVNAGQVASTRKVWEVPEVTSSFVPSENQITRGEKLTFIWVGRLDANKDPLTLIEGFISFLKVYPQAKLIMVFHTTELLDEVQNRVRNFASNIHLVGRIPHHEISTLYAKADFIISTSLFEAGGVAVLEGMACGCIPILSDIPSFKKISNEGNIGLLFERGSADALKDALLKAAKIDSSDERRKVLNYFKENLSSTAIADVVIHIILNDRKGRPSVLR